MRIVLILMLLCGTVRSQTNASTGMAFAPDVSRIYRTPEVDVKPEIKNGMYTLALFTSQNLKMPDVHNKKVKIFVGLTIETDGTVSDVKFIYMSAKDIDEAKSKKLTEEEKKYEMAQLEAMKTESVKVLSQFKETWKPAIKDGKPVRCLFNYPINFTME